MLWIRWYEADILFHCAQPRSDPQKRAKLFDEYIPLFYVIIRVRVSYTEYCTNHVLLRPFLRNFGVTLDLSILNVCYVAWPCTAMDFPDALRGRRRECTAVRPTD